MTPAQLVPVVLWMTGALLSFSAMAVSIRELSRALGSVPSNPRVLYLTPRTLAEIDENIVAVGEAIGRAAEAHALVATNRQRIDGLRAERGQEEPAVLMVFGRIRRDRRCRTHRRIGM